MAKKPSKAQTKAQKVLSPVVDTDDRSGVLHDILKSDMLKEVGMAIAGIVVGELLDKAIDRLMQSSTENQDVDLDLEEDLDPDQDSRSHHNPINQAASAVSDNAAELKASVKQGVSGAAAQVRGQSTKTKETIQALRATVSELTPDLSDVVAALKDVALQSIQQSGRLTSETANHAVETVATTTKSAMHAVSDRGKTKKDKRDKKKHKKKNKKSLDARSLAQAR